MSLVVSGVEKIGLPDALQLLFPGLGEKIESFCAVCSSMKALMIPRAHRA